MGVNVIMAGHYFSFHCAVCITLAMQLVMMRGFQLVTPPGKIGGHLSGAAIKCVFVTNCSVEIVFDFY